jgi:hypothetical protein
MAVTPSNIPAPHTWAVGEIPTAANWNAYIRDAFNFPLKFRPIMRGAQTSGSATGIGGGWTTIAPLVVEVDSNAGLNTITGLYTAPNAGWYIVTGSVVVNPNASSDIAIRLWQNSSFMPPGAFATRRMSVADRGACVLTKLVYMAANDTICAQAIVSSPTINTVVDSVECSSLECFFFSQ